MTTPVDDLQRVAADARQAETLVPCAACKTCPGCGGVGMVTVDRAREIRSGEVAPLSRGSR